MPSFDTLVELLASLGFDVRRALLGLARAAPLVLLVPAFGLRALPVAVRLAFGLALGLAAFSAESPAGRGGPYVVQLVAQLVQGLPVAITTAGGLWIASMAGGLVDDLRAAHERSSLPHVETEAPTGALFAMLAGLGFLVSGGPVQALRAMALDARDVVSSAVHVADALRSGIGLAVAIAAPLIVVAVVSELAMALVSRVAAPASLQSLVQPVRSLVLLGALAIFLDRVAALLLVAARSGY